MLFQNIHTSQTDGCTYNIAKRHALDDIFEMLKF